MNEERKSSVSSSNDSDSHCDVPAPTNVAPSPPQTPSPQASSPGSPKSLPPSTPAAKRRLALAAVSCDTPGPKSSPNHRLRVDVGGNLSGHGAVSFAPYPGATSARSGSDSDEESQLSEKEARTEAAREVPSVLAAIPRLSLADRKKSMLWGALAIPLVLIVLGTAIAQSGTAFALVSSLSGLTLAIISAVIILIAFLFVYAQVPVRWVLSKSRTCGVEAFKERKALAHDMALANRLGISGDHNKLLVFFHVMAKQRQVQRGLNAGLNIIAKHRYASLSELHQGAKGQYSNRSKFVEETRLTYRLVLLWELMVNSVRSSMKDAPENSKKNTIKFAVRFLHEVYRPDDPEWYAMKEIPQTFERQDEAKSIQEADGGLIVYSGSKSDVVELLCAATWKALREHVEQVGSEFDTRVKSGSAAYRTRYLMRLRGCDYSKFSESLLLSRTFKDLRAQVIHQVTGQCPNSKTDRDRFEAIVDTVIKGFGKDLRFVSKMCWADELTDVLVACVNRRHQMFVATHYCRQAWHHGGRSKSRSLLAFETDLYGWVSSHPSWEEKSVKKRRAAHRAVSSAAFLVREEMRAMLLMELRRVRQERAEADGQPTSEGWAAQHFNTVFKGQSANFKPLNDLLDTAVLRAKTHMGGLDIPGKSCVEEGEGQTGLPRAWRYPDEFERLLKDAAYVVVHEHLDALKASEGIFTDDIDRQQGFVHSLMLKSQWRDRKIHPGRHGKRLRRRAAFIGRLNVLANAITVLFGGVMGVEKFKLGFSAGANIYSWLLAVFFVVAGVLGSITITRLKTEKLGFRLGLWLDAREAEKARRQALEAGKHYTPAQQAKAKEDEVRAQQQAKAKQQRVKWALLLGSFTTLGAAVFAGFSGLHLIHGFGPDAKGLRIIFPFMSNAPLWVSLVLAIFDATLTIICAGALYNAFCLKKFTKRDLSYDVKPLPTPSKSTVPRINSVGSLVRYIVYRVSRVARLLVLPFRMLLLKLWRMSEASLACCRCILFGPKRKQALKLAMKGLARGLLHVFAITAAFIQMATYGEQALLIGGANWIMFALTSVLCISALITFFATFDGSARNVFGMLPDRLAVALDKAQVPLTPVSSPELSPQPMPMPDMDAGKPEQNTTPASLGAASA